MATLTEALAQFTLKQKFAALPPSVFAKAKLRQVMALERLPDMRELTEQLRF